MLPKRSRTEWNWLLGLMLSLLLGVALGSTAEAQEFGLGDIPLDEDTYQSYLMEYDEATLPASYDARNEGIVTSPKNQGSCGSCWAFASTGAMESHILKAGGPQYDLSEQQINSCHTGMSGCCGGSSTAPRFWETQGPILESCGPYGDGGTSCPTRTSVSCSSMSGCTELDYRVTNFHTVTQTATGFKTSLYDYGPSYWRYVVYNDFMTYWHNAPAGAVYTNGPGTSPQGGHAVLLIGWSDAKGALLCKNSWGATGGPNGDGTFWIAYSGHYNNLGFAMSNFELEGGGGEELCLQTPNGQNLVLAVNNVPSFGASGQLVDLSWTLTSGFPGLGTMVKLPGQTRWRLAGEYKDISTSLNVYCRWESISGLPAVSDSGSLCSAPYETTGSCTSGLCTLSNCSVADSESAGPDDDL
jgi:hypothetical protein